MPLSKLDHKLGLAAVAGLLLTLFIATACQDFCLDPSGRNCYGYSAYDSNLTDAPDGGCAEFVPGTSCETSEDCPVLCCACSTVDGGTNVFGRQLCFESETGLKTSSDRCFDYPPTCDGDPVPFSN